MEKGGDTHAAASIPERIRRQMKYKSSHSVKKLSGIVRIAQFFLLVATLAIALDAIIGLGLRRIPTSKFGSLNRVRAGQVNADIIINGSSRALTHYDPRVLMEATGKTAYNLGLNGVQTDVQLAMLKFYLRGNTKPKLVVQNLESFSFETTREGELYDPATYVPYLQVDELYQSLQRIDSNVWKWKYIPLYGYVVEDMKFTWVWGLLGCIGFYGREDYILGFNPRYMNWTEDFDRFRAEIGAGVTYRIESKGVAALREIVSICHVRGIDIALVFSPEYIEMQQLERNRDEVFGQFRRIAEEFNVPFWDYSGSPISLNRDNFYNSQHLNARGAAHFSRDLAGRVTEHLAQKDGRSVSTAAETKR